MKASDKKKVSAAMSIIAGIRTPARRKASQANGRAFGGRKPDQAVLDACYDYTSANGGTLYRQTDGVWLTAPSHHPMSATVKFTSVVVFHLVREGRAQFTKMQNFGGTRIGCEATIV